MLLIASAAARLQVIAFMASGKFYQWLFNKSVKFFTLLIERLCDIRHVNMLNNYITNSDHIRISYSVAKGTKVVKDIKPHWPVEFRFWPRRTLKRNHIDQHQAYFLYLVHPPFEMCIFIFHRYPYIIEFRSSWTWWSRHNFYLFTNRGGLYLQWRGFTVDRKHVTKVNRQSTRN